jgi:hypothetical protein
MFGFYTLDEYEPEPPVKVFRFRIIYWNMVEWKQEDVTLLATTKEQCEAWADKQCPVHHRQRDYPEGRKDSLQIIKLAEVTLPFEL